MAELASVALSDTDNFEIVSGLWKGKKGPFARCNVLRSTNFRPDGLLDYSNIAELDVEERQLSTRELESGDIIVERSGGGPKQAVGRIGLFVPISAPGIKYSTSNFTSAIRVLDTESLLPEYVALFLHSIYMAGGTESLQRATTGIRNLDWKEYLSFEVPILPMRLQVALHELIGGVREAYKTEQEIIERLISLKSSAMHDLFTRGLKGEAQQETDIGPIPESWDLVEFSELRESLKYGTSKSCSLAPKKYPVLRIPNIEPGRVNPTELKYCDLSEKEAHRYVLEEGDLIFIRTNGVLERLGACAVYSSELEHCLFASYLIRARLDLSKAVPKYVAYFFESHRGTNIVTGRATPAADGKYNLNSGAIDSLVLPLPPTKEEQNLVVEILSAVDAKIDLHKRKRGVLEDLFQSLLHKLMTGEVRVSDLDLSASMDFDFEEVRL